MNGASHRSGRPARPLHPPFIHFPLAAYVFAAGFDIASAADGGRDRWAGQLWHAGTFVLIGGLIIGLITMGTGFWDLVRFWPRQPAASAPGAPPPPDPFTTVSAHLSVMAAAFMIGAGDVAWRLSEYGSRAAAPLGVAALSVTAAIVACVGGHLGGKLVFRHAMGVAATALRVNPRLPGERAADDHGRVTGVTSRRPAGWDGRDTTRGDTAP